MCALLTKRKLLVSNSNSSDGPTIPNKRLCALPSLSLLTTTLVDEVPSSRRVRPHRYKRLEIAMATPPTSCLAELSSFVNRFFLRGRHRRRGSRRVDDELSKPELAPLPSKMKIKFTVDNYGHVGIDTPVPNFIFNAFPRRYYAGL